MEMLKEGEQYSIETTFRASRFTICLVTLKSLNPGGWPDFKAYSD